MNLRNFFAELKRRNVYKVAVAYAVVAWLLIQIATQVFPFFEIPNWGVRLVVLVITAGFPIALVVAWAFELTTGGIKRTELADETQSQSSFRHAWIYVTIFAGAVSIGLFLVGRYTAPSRQDRFDEIPEKSIAVLPFDNLSRDPDNAYFAEGVQDEILTRLSKLTDFKVISRTSTQRFKSAPEDLPQIARQLGVRNILEGSVQRVTDQVRVNVQLIRASTDAHLWADSYDRKMTDIFGVESEIAQAVADNMEAKLTGSEKHAMTKRPTENAGAHDLYLRGRFFWNKRTADDLQTALGYFEQAAQADQNYAVAYAGMADCYLLLPLYGNGAPADLYPKARTMAEKAIVIDPSLAEPHASLGLLNAIFDLDFSTSMREFEQAIQLNPNYATAHQWFGDSTLPALGQFDRANAEMKRALELDPLSIIINVDVGTTYWITGRYQEAVAQLRKAIEMDPHNYSPHQSLAQALEGTGDLPGAIAEYEKARQLTGDPYPLGLLGAAKAKTGDRPGALAILEQLETTAKRSYVADYLFALIHIALGEKDEAIRWLESSYAKHQPDTNWIRVDPDLRPLHGDPRFETLAEKIVPKREFASAAPAAKR
jgi:TolB-like protein/tetratricopeptide (TPR) repeat protein